MKLVTGKSNINNFNLFDHPIISAYFKLKEYLLYTSEGRDFYPRLIREILRFIKKTSNSEAEIVLDEVIFATINKLNRSMSNSMNLIEELRQTNEKGFELLGIRETIDLDVLKALYREAAKKHHPDLGGSNENMLIINESFTSFHEIIQYHLENNSDDYLSYGQPKSAFEFLSDVAYRLLIIYEDIWAVDKAYSWFKTMEIKEWITPYTLTGLHRLSKRLYAANMKTEANEIFGYAYSNYKKAKEEGIDYGADIDSTRAILEGKSKLRVVINHHYQAKNAFRLNIIDKKKLDVLNKRFQEKKLEYKNHEEKLRSYIKSTGFIKKLPSEPDIHCINIENRLIPMPSYVNMHHPYLAELSDEQQTEYIIAFSEQTNLNLLKKYVYVRINSYMMAVIKHYYSVDVHKILEECNLFLNVIKDNRTRFSFHCRSVIKFIEEIYKMPGLEREQRLSILGEIHELSLKQRYESNLILGTVIVNATIDGALTIDINSSYESNYGPLNCIIGPISQYADDALLPLDTLRAKLESVRRFSN